MISGYWKYYLVVLGQIYQEITTWETPPYLGNPPLFSGDRPEKNMMRTHIGFFWARRRRDFFCIFWVFLGGKRSKNS